VKTEEVARLDTLPARVWAWYKSLWTWGRSWFYFRVGLFLFVSFQLESKGGLVKRFHTLDTTCGHEPLPANQSGVKVLVAGFAKMGTRTLSRTLYELGMDHSYHGEEFLVNAWAQHSKDFWARPENGAMSPPKCGLRGKLAADMTVLNNTSPEQLALLYSRCRVDAQAFDGIERLFWPTLEVSPGAKVIVLNWRTYAQLRKSMRHFSRMFLPFIMFTGLLASSLVMLPWGIFFPIFEYLSGGQIDEFLRTGSPPLNQHQWPLLMLWIRMTGNARMTSHWFCGLSMWRFLTQERMTNFFAEIHRAVPPERRMDFDPRKNTYEDLCKFLELKECKRSGKIPRAINMGNHERDFPLAFWTCVPIWLFFHWLNWRIAGLVLGPPWRWACRVVPLLARRAREGLRGRLKAA